MAHLIDKKKRTNSSRQWLLRQINDPYVIAAKAQGYRSRAAFKLQELDDKFHFLKKGAVIIDLGAAPGGWTQVALSRTQPKETSLDSPPHVIGIDLLEMEPLPGSLLIQGDFLSEEGLQAVLNALAPFEGRADVVLSDMAPSSCGHRATDHLRILDMIETAFDFAQTVLRPGGAFVAKTLQGGTEHTLLTLLKQNFIKVAHAKPPASRQASAELYLVAQGFRGEKKVIL